jgi:hypothetical protein
MKECTVQKKSIVLVGLILNVSEILQWLARNLKAGLYLYIYIYIYTSEWWNLASGYAPKS